MDRSKMITRMRKWVRV